jgi:hypothetical protein
MYYNKPNLVVINIKILVISVIHIKERHVWVSLSLNMVLKTKVINVC